MATQHNSGFDPKIAKENLYLHFFNRETYRGIFGDKIDEMQLNHTDILTTQIICGMNKLYGSFSSFHETISILSEKGKIYRRLYEAGILKVVGETLNDNVNMSVKQKIYAFDRERYPGYFGKEARELDLIASQDVKNDVTDRIDNWLTAEAWDDVYKFAPTERDRKTLKHYEEKIREITRFRDVRAITKSLFQSIGDDMATISIGRTLSGMYIADYREFTGGDIITGVKSLEEYDSRAVHFPYHDYKISRAVLSYLGFPREFGVREFEKAVELFESDEHIRFALEFQRLLYFMGGRPLSNSIVRVPLHRARESCLSHLKLISPCAAIDYDAPNYYTQALEQLERILREFEDGDANRGSDGNQRKKAFVVSGRNEELRISIGNLLRFLGIDPMDFDEGVSKTDMPTPALLDAIYTSILAADVVIVILAPEDRAVLRECFQEAENETDGKERVQPRLDVVFEAGLSWGIKPKKTIFMRFGNADLFSDIEGLHYLEYKDKKNDHRFRMGLIEKLKSAGLICSPRTDYFNIDIKY